jgi:hypothetical protein
MEAEWLRWMDEQGRVLPTSPEAASTAAERVDTETERANAEAERANAEAERARRLEAELEALKRRG